MSVVTVRQAVLADLDVAAALFDRYRRFQGRPSDLAAATTFLRERFDHGESIVFVAFSAEGAVGFAQLYPSYSSVALARVFVVNDLYVAEAGRRRGVASRLLAAAEAHAWSVGAARVTLNVALDNAPGQALYEALGWSADRHFRTYHRYPDAASATGAGRPPPD